MRLSGAPRRLVAALSRRSGDRPTVGEICTRPWASANFAGTRHRLVLRFEGKDADRAVERMTDGIEDAEFDLGPDLLVDIAVIDRCRQSGCIEITLEALTIEGD
ncbi:MAG: hypothetical protein ABR601_04560 [Parasphingopyxis sp.]|nr:hypothetical protein [Sphingomonadales bacterium]